MNIRSYEAYITDEEIRDYPFDIVSHIFKRMESELNRSYPHGPIHRSQLPIFKLKVQVLTLTTEWKEPIQ